MSSLDAVDLGDNFSWVDEFTWSPVAGTTERTLTGAMVVEESPKPSGRPITLRGEWLTRTTVESLRTLELQLETPMTLTLLDGRTFTVLWRRSDGAAVEARPLYPIANPDSEMLYEVTLRLMEAPQ